MIEKPFPAVSMTTTNISTAAVSTSTLEAISAGFSLLLDEFFILFVVRGFTVPLFRSLFEFQL
jgi:hypothetical protein